MNLSGLALFRSLDHRFPFRIDPGVDREFQIVVNDFAEPERKICRKVNSGHDFKHRQFRNGRECVGVEGQGSWAAPHTLQLDVIKAIFDELADAWVAVDVRNELELCAIAASAFLGIASTTPANAGVSVIQS